MKNYILSAFADEYTDDFEGQLAALQQFHIPNIELRFIDGINVADLNDAQVSRVQYLLDKAGIRVSSIGSPLGKIALDGDLDTHFEKAARVFRTANILGTANVRCFSFYPASGKAISDCREEVIAQMARLIELADDYGVTLCHENEADIYGESPESCLDLLAHFGGRLKAVFDMGNFVLGGYDPMKALAVLQPYIQYFHIKDALYAGAIVPPGKGEACIPEILKAFPGNETVVTLEPHLQTFSGFNALTGRNFNNPYQYPDQQAAFSHAVSCIREVLEAENMKQLQADKLCIQIYPNRREMGQAAAREVREKILELLSQKPFIYMIFAAAPSQNDVLTALVADPAIPWERIHAFHMDEYIHLPSQAPQSFANYLREHLFDQVPFASVNCLNCQAEDPQAECLRYEALLAQYPADIVVLGIGENGHIAFNDPRVARFDDPQAVKIVALDAVCRQQQVNDGCFDRLDAVPTHAMTLTVPALTRAPYLFCIVPGPTKTNAVQKTVLGPISEECPASILRQCQGAKLYLDRESGALL